MPVTAGSAYTMPWTWATAAKKCQRILTHVSNFCQVCQPEHLHHDHRGCMRRELI